jgi:hypothetical protein
VEQYRFAMGWDAQLAPALDNSFGARVLRMAAHAKGKPHEQWPAWSTGETLAVALVLNDWEALKACSYTMAEAFDRVELSAAELRSIERALAK